MKIKRFITILALIPFLASCSGFGKFRGGTLTENTTGLVNTINKGYLAYEIDYSFSIKKESVTIKLYVGHMNLDDLRLTWSSIEELIVLSKEDYNSLSFEIVYYDEDDGFQGHLFDLPNFLTAEYDVTYGKDRGGYADCKFPKTFLTDLSISLFNRDIGKIYFCILMKDIYTLKSQYMAIAPLYYKKGSRINIIGYNEYLRDR